MSNNGANGLKMSKGTYVFLVYEKLLDIAISYHMAVIEERSIKKFLPFLVFGVSVSRVTCLYEKSLLMHFERKYLLKELLDFLVTI